LPVLLREKSDPQNGRGHPQEPDFDLGGGGAGPGNFRVGLGHGGKPIDVGVSARLPRSATYAPNSPVRDADAEATNIIERFCLL
jgi:hypothetical protein